MALVHEKVWIDKKQYDDAERQYQERLAKLHKLSGFPKLNSPLKVIPPVASSPAKSTPLPPSCPIANLSKKNKNAKNVVVTQHKQNEMPQPLGSPKKSRKNKKDKSAKFNANRATNPALETLTCTDNIIIEQLSSKDILTSPLEKEIQLIPVKQTDLVAKLNKDNKEKSEKSKKVECEKKKVDSPIKEAEKMDSIADFAGAPSAELTNRITSLAKENADLKQVVEDLRKLVLGIQQQVNALESKVGGVPVAPKTAPAPKADESDDGVDLFASDSEDEGTEAVKIREERLAAYAAKKAKKPVLIAKSNIILDVKPWDDETDMKAMEAAVRTIQADGLLWGAAKLVPLAYGIHKLQISSVVEDDKVSVDWLQEELEKLEDFVQSVDIAAFNKV